MKISFGRTKFHYNIAKQKEKKLTTDLEIPENTAKIPKISKIMQTYSAIQQIMSNSYLSKFNTFFESLRHSIVLILQNSISTLFKTLLHNKLQYSPKDMSNDKKKQRFMIRNRKNQTAE